MKTEKFRFKLKEGNATIEFLSLHLRNAKGYLKHLVKDPKKWELLTDPANQEQNDVINDLLDAIDEMGKSSPDYDFINNVRKKALIIKDQQVVDIIEIEKHPIADIESTMEPIRYFNLRQHTEPRSMFIGAKLVDIKELETVGNELSKDEAETKPKWGSGNISVNEKGEWNWVRTNFDTSG